MLTDKQLELIHGKGRNESGHMLTHHNGFECRRVFKNGMCEGVAIVVNGELELRATCNKPCSWICNDARKLKESIDTVKAYDRVIEAVKGMQL